MPNDVSGEGGKDEQNSQNSGSRGKQPARKFSSDNTVLLLPDSEILHIPTATRRDFRQFDNGVLNHDGSLVAAFPVI
jgi:hypothetical protein